MKKVVLFSVFTIFLISCKTEVKQAISAKENLSQKFQVSDELIETAVIYEANIRQYSPEGTFEAFRKDIPALKSLGVKVIWVMPINPISKIKRKATGDLFTSQIRNEKEREKYLGSYYSVSDYKAINPEFGSLEDFKHLVNTAHDNGIAVIVDWVPNHTGWDHPWIEAHPEYYTKNNKGEIIDPINPDTGKSWGWTDVADLNYDNQEMRKEMINDMKYWVTEADIDGFRMDVAHKVPPSFFKEALAEMRTVKSQFMLAEAEQPELLKDGNGFDMQYAWEGHHLLNEMAKGDKTKLDFINYMERVSKSLEEDDIMMNFVTNHDENSWNGTLLERMPNNKELFSTLIYCMPGMPLIYSGQEYDMSHRLKFFEKDSIPKAKGSYFDLLQKLGKLKNESPALNGGKMPASFKIIDTGNDHIIGFYREKNGVSMSYFANLSSKVRETPYEIEGHFKEYLSDKRFFMPKFQPYEVRIVLQ